MNKRAVGTRYEQVAAEYLQSCGYKIYERNYRCRVGEIDLIAGHRGYLVFIEVKYRKNGQSGWPQEAVTWQKQKKLRQCAVYYMRERKIPANYPCRFDVAAVGEGITVIENAFGGM